MKRPAYLPHLDSVPLTTAIAFIAMVDALFGTSSLSALAPVALLIEGGRGVLFSCRRDVSAFVAVTFDAKGASDYFALTSAATLLTVKRVLPDARWSMKRASRLAWDKGYGNDERKHLGLLKETGCLRIEKLGGVAFEYGDIVFSVDAPLRHREDPEWVLSASSAARNAASNAALRDEVKATMRFFMGDLGALSRVDARPFLSLPCEAFGSTGSLSDGSLFRDDDTLAFTRTAPTRVLVTRRGRSAPVVKGLLLSGQWQSKRPLGELGVLPVALYRALIAEWLAIPYVADPGRIRCTQVGDHHLAMRRPAYTAHFGTMTDAHGERPRMGDTAREAHIIARSAWKARTKPVKVLSASTMTLAAIDLAAFGSDPPSQVTMVEETDQNGKPTTRIAFPSLHSDTGHRLRVSVSGDGVNGEPPATGEGRPRAPWAGFVATRPLLWLLASGLPVLLVNPPSPYGGMVAFYETPCSSATSVFVVV